MSEVWIKRVCPNCGKEVSFLEKDVRLQCDTDGFMTIRCPSCIDGKILLSLPTPLTEAEVLDKLI